MRRNRRQRCVSESDSQSPVKLKNGQSSAADRDIIAILANAQMEFNQRASTSTLLRSVPSLQSDLDYNNSSSCTEKLMSDKKILPSVNGSLVADGIQGADSSTRKRFLSSGTPSSKPSCSKQLFESPSRDLPSLALATSLQEARSQFLKSRTFSLNITPSKNTFQELLVEKCDSELENNSKVTRMVANSFLSSGGQIPEEETSTPVMTPEMFEQTAVPPSSLKEPPSFVEKPRDLHNLSPFPSWKDQHSSGINQVVPPFQNACTPSKSVYSPEDFQNSPGDLGNGFLTSNESSHPTENVLPCNDTQPVSKEQLANSLIYLLSNDSSMLSKIHEAYISSLKTHLYNFKK